MFRKAGKMVVDRWLGLLSRTLLLRKGQKKRAIHTAVVMQSRRSLVTSAHSDCERRSCELAQQASMEANSAAQGALRASFLGRTLSCSNFMMVDESEHVTTLKATKKRCRGKCHVVDASPRVHRPTWQRRSFPLTVTCCDDIMVRSRPCITLTPQSEKKQGTHTPLTQAQLAALASRNSSAMRYVCPAS